ncbi:MAG: hypothetical protein JEZ01_16345 [Labilibaculum sp.]|nr:hypothetical protein [Labilibaculum sp.]MBI9059333.1 hypothetical protein [Labilibaculum sp.]
MKFKYLNVKTFKGNFRKKDSAKTISSSRRNFFKGLGIAVLAFQPTLKLFAKALDDNLKYSWNKKKLVFFSGKEQAWIIDTKVFAGNPKLKFFPEGDDWIIRLEDARFPGTDIPVDFKATIYKEFDWRIYIQFSHLDVYSDMSFSDWINEKSIISGSDYLSERISLSDGYSLDIEDHSHILIDKYWMIELKGKELAILNIKDNSLPLQEISLSIPNKTKKKNYTSKINPYCQVSFKTNKHETLFSAWRFEEDDKQLVNLTKKKETYSIIKGIDENRNLLSLLFSEFEHDLEPLFYFHKTSKSGVKNKIGLYNPKLAVELSSQDEKMILLASLAGNGEWIYESDNAMLIGNNANESAIEFRGLNGCIDLIQGSAKIMASHFLLADAISLPVDYPEQPVVELDFQDQKIQKKKKVLKDASLGTIKFREKEIIRLSLLRPEDMLFLQFEFYNFKYIKKDQQSFLEVDNPKKPAAMIVLFPPQHTLEQAFWENNSLPGGAGNENVILPAKYIRSGKSRLVFTVPANFEGMPIIMDRLLDWSDFKLKVNYRARVIEPVKVAFNKFQKFTKSKISNTLFKTKAPNKRILNVANNSKNRLSRQNLYDSKNLSAVLPPSVSSQLNTKINYAALKSSLLEMRKPSAFETSIEAPTRLFISPNQLAGFAHQNKIQLKDHQEFSKGSPNDLKFNNPLITNKGKLSELWHSRLGVRLKNGEIDENSMEGFRTIRALWARDARKNLKPKPPRKTPFRASLDSRDRHNIVHQTSNFLIKGYQPRSVKANRLMLTSLGAWLDFYANFDYPDFQAQADLELLEWEHLATLGRDHYVKVVEAGFLFPFGHSASLVKITERKPDKATRTAVNRQRMYIVILEPVVYYEMRDPQNGFIPFPFQTVEMMATKTPDLAEPVNLTDLGGDYNFWIKSGGAVLEFDLLVVDQEGEEKKIRIPMMFVGKSAAYDQSKAEKIVSAYNAEYNLSKADFNHQDVAYSPSLVEGDTQFETIDIHYGAQILENKASAILKFHPTIRTANIKVQAIEELTGNPDPVLIELRDDDNAGKIFAKVLGNLKADFSGGSDQSGGFMSPNTQVTSLSKLKGPLGGAIDKLEKLDFDPAEFFGAGGDMPVAKLFGAVSIFELLLGNLNFGAEGNQQADALRGLGNLLESLKEDILEQQAVLENAALDAKAAIEQEIQNLQNQLSSKVNELEQQLSDQVPRIPNFNTYRTNKAFVVEYRWIPEMEASKSLFGDFLTVNVQKPKEALQVLSRLSRPFDTSQKTQFGVDASFTDFSVEIKELIKVSFESLKFGGGSGRKADVKVVMAEDDSILFLGPLSFVNQLQNLIPSNGFADGPYMKLSPSGVKAGFDLAIPSVEVGVCTIANMTLGAGVHLPFTGAPLTLQFNFCKREAPFLLTVSAFGGGGFFLMKTSVKGFVGMEAAFEFGAALSMNFGVASGGVSVMGGFYFSMEIVDDQTQTVLTGYIRINGYLSILGIISLSIEIYLAFVAMFQNGKVEKLYGEAIVKVKVEVLFFSKTVTLTARRELKGADADPTFQMIMEENDWLEYCNAYA